MFRQLLIIGIIGAAIAGVVVWFVGIPGSDPVAIANPSGKSGADDVLSSRAMNVDVGAPLYKTRPPLIYEVSPPSPAPIVIEKAHLSTIDKQEVPSQRDGVLLFVASEVSEPSPDMAPKDKKFYFSRYVPCVLRELKPGELAKINKNDIVELPLPNDEKERMHSYVRACEGDTFAPNAVRIQWEAKWFKELHVGDKVKAGQLLAIIDPVLAWADVESKITKMNAKEADRVASDATRKEAHERYVTLLKLRTGAAAEEVRGAKLTEDKYYYEEISKRGEVSTAERELSQALTYVRMHEVRSKIDGVITEFYKYPGEAVKAQENVMQIQNHDDLRAEGRVDIQYLSKLRLGLHVRIEPTVQVSPYYQLQGHINEVNAVAVSGDEKNPLIVSASEDGTVRVWDRKSGEKYQYVRQTLAGTIAVRSVACPPPGCDPSVKDLCLSGSVDGIGRLWDLTKDGNQAARELSGEHKGPITCVAFSPDGKYCITGGEDRNIVLWEVASAKRKYVFPAGHKGGVTSLQFTPNGQLVSAGRDGAILVWTLGENGARLEKLQFDRRSGDVATLGVSPNGRQVLFDRGRELRLLSLKEGRTEGVLENGGGSANFTTFALFSPDGKMALTASGSDAQLQLWRLPSSGTGGSLVGGAAGLGIWEFAPSNTRAYEARQLISVGATTTCAAFSPFAHGKERFIVTGARDGMVFIWPMPSEVDMNDEVTGEITLREPSLEGGTRQVRVWARITNNPGLIKGNTATVVAFPER